ncbi:sec-independent translocase [Streptomyces nojiriensis]|uniref:Sec-independent protein translocase protein TatB n=1 Tax=Streptomyces nojiriensis TaxID=66374 RepID=A0ABQ3T1B2_9ACTN|nr:sec-independent translocase [Streptomyces nojiriensis]QTI47655.1 Sec-independent protein translocase protein TatB [Streptomyces nojiriensis]GGR76455.1 sec-independent protein translocase protein TatB [Streptomyces nojiriensis]GHI74156.1 sec-independent protein translocase protein TatB [Streptomyces nojiriensis]
MFNDIGALELVTIVVLGILVFGPDKLPKVIQDVTGFIRKIRAFSDSAKQDIRSELGPEFKDFEFEDLNPKTFIRKQLTENEDLKEIRTSFDLRKELSDVSDAVKSSEAGAAPAPSATAAAGSATPAVTGPDLLKKPAAPAPEERSRFDADAT